MTLASIMSPDIVPARVKTFHEPEIPVNAGQMVFVYVMTAGEAHPATVTAPYTSFTDMGDFESSGPKGPMWARVFYGIAARSEPILAFTVEVDHDEPWGISAYVGDPEDFEAFARRMRRASES